MDSNQTPVVYDSQSESHDLSSQTPGYGTSPITICWFARCSGWVSSLGFLFLSVNPLGGLIRYPCSECTPGNCRINTSPKDSKCNKAFWSRVVVFWYPCFHISALSWLMPTLHFLIPRAGRFRYKNSFSFLQVSVFHYYCRKCYFLLQSCSFSGKGWYFPCHTQRSVCTLIFRTLIEEVGDVRLNPLMLSRKMTLGLLFAEWVLWWRNYTIKGERKSRVSSFWGLWKLHLHFW